VVEKRRLVDDARQALGRRRDFMGDVFLGLFASFRNPLIVEATEIFVASHRFTHMVERGHRIPRFEHPKSRALSNQTMIRRDSHDRHLSCLLGTESAPTCSDDETRGEPLQIPLEGRWQGLVEIIDVED
jgi:hypothetical protein